MQHRETKSARLLFIYWGRRGALSRFTLDLSEAALADDQVDPIVSVSRSNELFAEFVASGVPILPVRTYSQGRGALTQLWRVPLLRREIAKALRENRTQAVVVLMSHLWTPLVASAVRRCGVAYGVIVHDARPHPDDRTAHAHRWLMRDLKYADRVIALSSAVADQLQADGRVEPERLRVLFHPLLGAESRVPLERSGPLRALFFGRIMGYKGLSLFVDAIEELRARGLPIEASVVGEGSLGGEGKRLEALGAEIQNRWVNDREIPDIFARHDVAVLSHVEASQSGVAALAHGYGIPVVSTPVGGLARQVIHGRTGLLAERADAPALADALARLLIEPGLWERLVAGIAETRNARSMSSFLVRLREVMLL